MSVQPQLRAGYIRGVRGVVAQSLLESGLPAAPVVRYGIRTAQQVAVETVVVSGEESVLRGGDRVLVRIKDMDVVVGVNLTFQNARFDACAMELLAGGTLITAVIDTILRVNGWEAPTVAQQATPRYFRLEVYAVNHSVSGGVDGFVQYTFPYCRATFGNETLQDQNWVIPELNIECTESPQGGGAYRKEFISALPAELV